MNNYLYLLLVLLGINNCATNTRTFSSTETCDVKNFGAIGDGVTKDTKAIQAAIDACADKNGTVLLKQGTFLSGMITLKSNLKFVIDVSATLKASEDDLDYPDTNPPTNNSQLHNCKKALIYGEGIQNIFIEGGGTIDGSGGNPNWGKDKEEPFRPMTIFIVLSNHVTIQNLQIKDSAMWTVVNMETDNLVIKDITINSLFKSNRDGIDIVDCHDALIENVTIASGDDSICFKSGVARGVENVTVKNSRILHSGANGLKFGTASKGAFKNVTFDNIQIDDVKKAVMAVESVDGATIDNIYFKNINFKNSGAPVFIILGKRGKAPQVGSINNVRFENIQGKDMNRNWGSIITGTKIDGTTYSPQNISFSNVQIVAKGGFRKIPNDPPEYEGQYPDVNIWDEMPAYGYYIRHVNKINFENSSITASKEDARPAIVRRDVSDFLMK